MCDVHNIASDSMCSLIFKMFQPALGSSQALILCVPVSFNAGNVAGQKQMTHLQVINNTKSYTSVPQHAVMG